MSSFLRPFFIMRSDHRSSPATASEGPTTWTLLAIARAAGLLIVARASQGGASAPIHHDMLFLYDAAAAPGFALLAKLLPDVARMARLLDGRGLLDGLPANTNSGIYVTPADEIELEASGMV